MSDIYGRNLKIEVFGGSHDPEIGMELTAVSYTHLTLPTKQVV